MSIYFFKIAFRSAQNLQSSVNRKHNSKLRLLISQGVPAEANSVATTPSPTTTMVTTATSLPRGRVRGDRRIRRLNTELLEAVENKDFDEVEK